MTRGCRTTAVAVRRVTFPTGVACVVASAPGRDRTLYLSAAHTPLQQLAASRAGLRHTGANAAKIAAIAVVALAIGLLAGRSLEGARADRPAPPATMRVIEPVPVLSPARLRRQRRWFSLRAGRGSDVVAKTPARRRPARSPRPGPRIWRPVAGLLRRMPGGPAIPPGACVAGSGGDQEEQG